MTPPSWDREKKSDEQVFEDKVRDIMYKRRITYQEAANLVKKGQRSIFEF